MRMRRASNNSVAAALLCTMFVLLVTALVGCNSANNEDASKEGVAAATKWVESIDAGKYDDAWEASADEIKTAGPKKGFARMMGMTRSPLGKELNRAVKDKAYAKDPQNAPPGEYVQMHFSTSFENAKSATETVIVKKQPDGAWKVGQYSVNPD